MLTASGLLALGWIDKHFVNVIRYHVDLVMVVERNEIEHIHVLIEDIMIAFLYLGSRLALGWLGRYWLTEVR